MVRVMKTDFMMPAFCGVTEFKRCSDCKETKPATEFYKVFSGKDAGTRKNQCLSCQRIYQRDYQARNKDRAREASKEWAALHPENIKLAGLKYECKQLGLTLPQYQALEVFQNHQCAICKKKQDCGGKHRLCIDHCHATGRIRGLLCDRCNKMLGFSQDSLEILFSAIEYLKKESSV